MYCGSVKGVIYRVHLHAIPQALTSLRTVGLESEGSEGIIYHGGHKNPIEGIAVDSIGRHIATANGDGHVILWDVASCQIIEKVKINASFVAFIVAKPHDDAPLLISSFRRIESDKEGLIILKSQVNSNY
jgi:hypothetical protein